MQGAADAGGRPISRTMKTVKTFVLAVFILPKFSLRRVVLSKSKLYQNLTPTEIILKYL